MCVRWLRFGLIGLLVVGCARKAPPVVRKVGAVQVSVPVVQESAPEAPPAQPTPAQWTLKLQDQDAGARQEAARALGELGEGGYAPLMQGLQHASAEVRSASLEGLTPVLVRRHQKEMVPLLLKLLEEKDPALRKGACASLTWPDQMLLDNEIQAGTMAKERLAALKKLAGDDKDATVRAAALAGAQSVQQAILGKIDRAALKSPLAGKDKADPRSSDRPMPRRELPR